MTDWYRNFAAALTGPHYVPEPLNHDKVADQRLIHAVSHDLRGEDGQATATAVRMIWTGDHLDTARRLRARSPDPPKPPFCSAPSHQLRSTAHERGRRRTATGAPLTPDALDAGRTDGKDAHPSPRAARSRRDDAPVLAERVGRGPGRRHTSWGAPAPAGQQVGPSRRPRG